MGSMSRLNPFSRDAINPPAPEVRDHLGKILGVGDQVLINKNGLLARVAQITPVLDPGAPPNLMRVRLLAVIDVALPRQAALEDVYRTTPAAELTPVGPATPPDSNGQPTDEDASVRAPQEPQG